MQIDHHIIVGIFLVGALLTGCGTSAQPTPAPPASPTTIIMTSQPAEPPGSAYPVPAGYPAPDRIAATAYPAPTSSP
jgi:hypothetical protein